ncbi:MAG: DUF1707 domain-containing protein [Chloroflexi bacterium]|nr:DUF1707 domain-containing protein [Chloroflexota bacterium]
MMQHDSSNTTVLRPTSLTQSTSSPTPRPSTRTYRASNEDRQRVVDSLQAHYVAGRLDTTELEARVERALAAVTLADLDAVQADLPPLAPLPPTSSTSTPAPSSRAGRREARKLARAGRCTARGERPFRAHLTSYVLVIGLLVVIWALTSPGGYFWPIWPALGWGIGLAAHGLGARKDAPALPTA